MFYKDSIFAIHLTNGNNYRFINQNPCLIVDTSSLYIYAYHTTKVTTNKKSSRLTTITIPVTYYYFSVGNHETVLMLTMENIRKYVLTDTLVHKTVCDKFTADQMLSEINPKTGRFVLNETILSVTKKWIYFLVLISKL